MVKIASPQPLNILVPHGKTLLAPACFPLDLFMFDFCGVSSQQNYMFRTWIVNLSPSVAFFFFFSFLNFFTQVIPTSSLGLQEIQGWMATCCPRGPGLRWQSEMVALVKEGIANATPAFNGLLCLPCRKYFELL